MSGKYYNVNTKSLQAQFPSQLKRIAKEQVEKWYYSEMGSETGENKPGQDWKQKMKIRPDVPYFTDGTDTPDKTIGK